MDGQTRVCSLRYALHRAVKGTADFCTFPDFAEFSCAQLLGEVDLVAIDFQMFEGYLLWPPRADGRQLVT